MQGIDVLAGARPPAVVRLGHRCVGLAQDIDAVALTFDNGFTTRASVVVGADGMRTPVALAPCLVITGCVSAARGPSCQYTRRTIQRRSPCAPEPP